MLQTPSADGWKIINDFSPGIRNIVSPNHPPGTAQETNTYRCHSMQGGALIPAPKLITLHYHYETPVVDPATPSNLASEEYRIIGLHVNNPVYWPGETETGQYQNNSEFYIGLEWWDNSNGGHVNWRTERYFRNYANTPHWETIWTTSKAGVFDPQRRPEKMEFAVQRSNYGHKLTLGPTVIAFCVSGNVRHFPDETDPSNLLTVAMPGDYSLTSGLVQPDSILGHQGRVVIFPLTLSYMGPNQVYTNSESFYWTQANALRTMGTADYLDETTGTENQYSVSAVFTEDPSGYQVKQSLSADEMLLIKGIQGAVIVRGSLDDFAATNYPYVKGTGFSQNRGVNSPKGFVYPVDAGGVWLWSGGEYSEHLTKHMSPNFWRPPAVAPANGEQSEALWGWTQTQCAQWNQLVMFPNNYFWDTDFDGWWRIDDPDDHIIYRWASDWRGLQCFGTPSGFNSSSDVAVYEYTKTIRAHDFSWQSQPLPDTIAPDREYEISDVILIASGRGRVYLTFSSASDPVGQRIAFDIQEELRPNAIRAGLRMQGSHITIRIESEGIDIWDEAPTVHEIRYKSKETSTIVSVDQA